MFQWIKNVFHIHKWNVTREEWSSWIASSCLGDSKKEGLARLESCSCGSERAFIFFSLDKKEVNPAWLKAVFKDIDHEMSPLRRGMV